jgi:hypothetical protein
MNYAGPLSYGARLWNLTLPVLQFSVLSQHDRLKDTLTGFRYAHACLVAVQKQPRHRLAVNSGNSHNR